MFRLGWFKKGLNPGYMRLVVFALKNIYFVTIDGVIHNIGDNGRVEGAFVVGVSNVFYKVGGS